MTGYLLLCLGAAIGAPGRYLTDRAIQARHDSLVPWGTLTVNAVGSLVLGLLAGLAHGHHVPQPVVLGVGTGFCGALTTYSTFGYETFRLYEAGARLYAAVNVVLSLVVGLGAAVLGFVVGSAG
jgi:fluoride exporter